MIGITGIAITINLKLCPDSTSAHGGFTLQNQKSSTFTQVETCPRGIKRSTVFAVQNHQGIEPVKVETAQRFRPSCHHEVCPARLDQVASHNDCIGC